MLAANWMWIREDNFDVYWWWLSTPMYRNGEEPTICDPVETRGCVSGMNNQEVLSNDWMVSLKKMVTPKFNTWEFQIDLLVKWWRKSTSEWKSCFVVALDSSRTMMQMGWSIGGWTSFSRFQRAASWTIEFSNILSSWRDDTLMWLVFFRPTANIIRWLEDWVFTENLFNVESCDNANCGTNIEDWLTKAWSILLNYNLDTCKEKYIVLMSDWGATYYGNWIWDTTQGYTIASQRARDKAHELKEQWIKIYAIWYSANESWEENLRDMAYNDSYYYAVNSSNTISKIFNDIWEEQVSTDDLIVLNIIDYMWDNILWDDINITSGDIITNLWKVYTYSFRINPNANWRNKTNSGLVFNYRNAEWHEDSLYISPDDSAEIYWKSPECKAWTLPNWDYVIRWSSTYTQIRNWSDDYYELVDPVNTEWIYTDSENPWECEWTCAPWYEVNEYNNDCKEIISTHTVSISTNWSGSVNQDSVTADFWSTISTSGNTLTIGDHTITATPDSPTPEYTHQFSWWILDDCGDTSNLTLSKDCTIIAEFKSTVNEYLITFNNRDGSELKSSLLPYWSIPQAPADPSRPSSNWQSYSFNGWNPPVTPVTQAQVYTATFTTNNWWWSSGWWLKKDYCPEGDFSWDFYDKKCWSKINTWKVEDTTVVTPEEKKEPKKKCSIEWSTHSKEVNEAYIWACENWIIKSDTIQWARLWEYLNRAEMAKIVTVFEMLVLDAKPNRNKDCSAFADSISMYNSEMKNYMITSCQLERMWIHTADHKPISDFMPRKFVSRAEFWTILSRILWWNKYEAPKNSSKYYIKHLYHLKENWLLSNIDPDLKERRSYAILMVYRAAKMLGEA